MTAPRLLGALVVLSLSFAACGDDGVVEDQAVTQDDSSDSSSNGSGSPDAGSSNDDSSDSSDTSIDVGDIPDGIPDGLIPEECQFFIPFGAALSLAFGGQTDFSGFEVAEAPDEIQDDVSLVITALADISDSPGAATQVFSDPDVEAALDNIEDFAAENCEDLGVGE